MKKERDITHLLPWCEALASPEVPRIAVFRHAPFRVQKALVIPLVGCMSSMAPDSGKIEGKKTLDFGRVVIVKAATASPQLEN